MSTKTAASEDVTATAEKYDPDMEPKSDELDKLKWRGDPEITLSDWKIEIVEAVEQESDSTPIVTTYHVHKYVLGYGCYKSSYFESIFRRSYAEGGTNTSRIELHPIAAEAFPQLLDFVYSFDDDSLHINSGNATALHYLGQYFQIDRLRWLSRQFWKQDMSLKNVHVYYQHAIIFHDDDISKAAAAICAKKIMKIRPSSSSIVGVADSKLWLSVLDEVSGDAKSLHISSLIAQHCEIGVNGDLDVETFKELTAEEKLPRLSFDAAVTLSVLEGKFTAVDKDDSNVQSAATNVEMSSLQKRCVESMAKDWENVDNSDATKLLKQKNPMVLVEVLTRSSAQARHELVQAKRELAQANRELFQANRELTQGKKEIEFKKKRKY